nr:GTPase-associated system all-helical protein GASH [uncultured Dyadobacter sp.]
MENKFLQSFLETGLFDIGDSDERLTYLEESIQELQNKLKETPSLLPVYTLVALDPEIPDDEPVLKETEAIVTTHWRALRVKFKEMPRPILRGVILNALYNLASVDAYKARIIYLTGSNFYPYAKLGREKECIEKLITDLGELAETDAIEEWSLTEEEPSLKLSTLKINDFKFGSLEFDSEALKVAMRTAIGNTPSGHNTQHTGNSVWGEHFAENSSKGISKAFQTSLEAFSKSLSPSSIEAPINKFFTEFKKSLDANLKSSFVSLAAVERRSKLLWWKETLYSPSLKGSYRDLDTSLQPIVMAFDLYEQLPAITPVSVDYLLKDTLHLLNIASVDKKTFEAHLDAFAKAESVKLLKNYFKESLPEGRVTITDFIGLLVFDKASVSDFQRRTGIVPNETISLKDLAVVILHDLMTQNLISE